GVARPLRLPLDADGHQRGPVTAQPAAGLPAGRRADRAGAVVVLARAMAEPAGGERGGRRLRRAADRGRGAAEPGDRILGADPGFSRRLRRDAIRLRLPRGAGDAPPGGDAAARRLFLPALRRGAAARRAVAVYALRDAFRHVRG